MGTALDMQGIVREVPSGLQGGNGPSSGASEESGSDGGLFGIKGPAEGAGAATIAPVGVQTAGKLACGLGVDSLHDLVKSPGEAPGGATSKLGDRVTSSAEDKALGG